MIPASSRPPKPDGYSSDVEYKRQVRTERKFFRHQNERLEQRFPMLQDISRLMEATRKGQSRPIDINLTGIPARVVVAAEGRVNHDSFSPLMPNNYGFFNRNTPFQRKYSTSNDRDSRFPYPWTEVETVVLNSQETGAPPVKISYAHKAEPHTNHRGDCRVDFLHDENKTAFMEDHKAGSYSDISEKLSNLVDWRVRRTAEDNGNPFVDKQALEQNIAALLLNAGRHLYAITASDLADALCANETSITQSQIQFMNDLCYLLFVKEIGRRQSPRDTATHELPLASSLIRALKLVEIGRLSLKDVLNRDAPYGAFTGANAGQDVEGMKIKIRNINRFYHYFFLNTSKTSSKSEPGLGTDPRTIKDELARAFGGASDTDDAGYDSPDTQSPPPKPLSNNSSTPDSGYASSNEQSPLIPDVPEGPTFKEP